MCGISLVIDGLSVDVPWGAHNCCCRHHIDLAHLDSQLRRRGPDRQSFTSLSGDVGGGTSTANATVRLSGYVLHLRGDHGPTQQPLNLSNGSALLWNGEVFGGNRVVVPEKSNDTRVLADMLYDLEERSACGHSFLFAARDLLESVEGPFAAVYYSAKYNTLLFGRDYNGRRSLVVHSAEGQLVVASTCARAEGMAKLHALNLSAGTARESAPGRKRSNSDSKRTDGPKSTQDVEAEGKGERGDDGDGDGGTINSCWLEVPVGGLYCLRLHDTVLPSEAQGTMPVGTVVSIPWLGRSVASHPTTAGGKSVPPMGSAGVEDEDEGEEALLEGSFVGFRGADHGNAAFAPWLAASIPRHAISPLYFYDPTTDIPEAVSRAYLDALANAVRSRVTGVPPLQDGKPSPIGVMFSGGIDSMLLAALVHQTAAMPHPIELINVAFGETPQQTPDRIAGHKGLAELQRLPGADVRDFRFIEVDLSLTEMEQQRDCVLDLIYPCQTVMDMCIGTALWFGSRGIGTLHTTPRLEHLAGANKLLRHGGSANNAAPDLSSEQLEALRADPFQPLLRVLVREAVSTRDTEAGVLLSTIGKDYARQLPWKQLGYRKLNQYVNAAREQRLVGLRGVNQARSVFLVQSEHLDQVRKQLSLTATHKTTDDERPDESTCVGGAKCTEAPPLSSSRGIPYTVMSKLLILGMGADETCAGYARHQTAFRRRGTTGLQQELNRDFSRLWARNLGRDDRVVSDCSREGRFPFIDEQVLRVLSELPRDLSMICDMNKPLGVGDKMLIRTCGRMVGLTDSTMLQKRAIQFGTRIANRKVHGATNLGDISDEAQLRNPMVVGQQSPQDEAPFA